MNINKAVQNNEPEAHAYIRAYDHGAVEREIPYIMHLGDTDDIAQALEERMHNCVHFDWDEVHEMIEYVCNILELPEDQQCEQMINRLRGHLAAGESIDEELQGFVYDLFRKLCNDHNIQYADLDADNIIDAYEYILPKIKKHGVDTMIERMLDNIDKNNVKDVAYVIWIMCQDIEEDDVMGTKFRDACRETYDQYGMYAPWNQVWDEIEDNYI